MRDVAAQAGVSVATVSRVLAENYPVAPATRQRVLRAIRDLDYVANAHARALAGVGTETVAFVVEDVRGPSFAHAAHGVEQETARRGRLCLVCATGGDPRRELAVVKLMREQRAGAVILVGGIEDSPTYRARMAEFAQSLESAGSRLVLCGRPPLGEDVPATVVEYDNEGGAYGLSSHLLSAGHRRILFLGGLATHTTTAGRLAGHNRALADHGVEADPALVENGDFTRAYGYRRTRERIAAGVDFTAVFAGTDMVAAGALEAITEAGLRVPDDISLVGFDDIPLASDLTPKLTTVHVPYEELGRAAVRLALDRRERGGDRTEQHLVLGTHVVVRQSVRNVRRGG
ncbi:LacI family DNA-binding transcriptional regulator [Allostreptomyces psammosilenae]|uniref:LacI family DNA-binding transcriptional regulator n=1 Tax=Allostreptomyces psammosilenae TaxID=1892865 RepID=UPI0028B02551|nr:LacI family DNA-binding transcriptional regulator [Allostreptomyces psammosilenae]